MATVIEHASELKSTTPMMAQYLEIKAQYRDYILFYRLGDFFEMFFEDAVTASRTLELTLTGRDCGGGFRAAMCGVPFHKADLYVGRLVEAGFKVAICEQTENPSEAKGIVRREIVRVVTPGTVTDGSLLTEGKNNFLCALCRTPHGDGLAFADISTGELSVTYLTGADREARIASELATYAPSEILSDLPESSMHALCGFTQERFGTMLTSPRVHLFDRNRASVTFSEVFPLHAETFAGDEEGAKRAVCALVHYVRETQKCDASGFFRTLRRYDGTQYMEIDPATRRNLELCESMRTKQKKGSLLSVLDKTKTAMGGRMLREWVTKPLLHPAPILHRQMAVSAFVSSYLEREDVSAVLSRISDLERLTAKAVYGTANARDLRALCTGLSEIPMLRECLRKIDSDELRALSARIDPLTELTALLSRSLVDNPPLTVREGGMIREGYNEDVDYLRRVRDDGAGWMQTIEEHEREETGIKNLRVGYNKVFGYYIEVTNSALHLVPARYIRKQTLTGCERFLTEELKNMEATVLGASDKLAALEYRLFEEIRLAVSSLAGKITDTSSAIAELDACVSLASVAAENRYVRPEIDADPIIEIVGGRHPVVEQFVSDGYFVPNDTALDTAHNRLMLITGPNMAGKSTYMRQVALIALMAQIGSFVPADRARIGIVDKLFTRVGASDDLASGQSTFMLEMNEVAHILKNATRRSLIIYDEVGRGTSTYDGMSIARAVVEYSHSKKLGARTLFATHYHELTVLEDTLEGVRNYHIAAKKRAGEITFLRRILRGATDDSFGIDVARLAGVPDAVVRRAREILAEIESGATPTTAPRAKDEEEGGILGLSEHLSKDEETEKSEAVAARLRTLDLDTLTPLEAMNLVYSLKAMLS